MSDTPRTDEIAMLHLSWVPGKAYPPIMLDFARTIERELAAARAENRTLRNALYDLTVERDKLNATYEALCVRNLEVIAERDRLRTNAERTALARVRGLEGPLRRSTAMLEALSRNVNNVEIEELIAMLNSEARAELARDSTGDGT